MGGNSSRRQKAATPFPQYPAAGNSYAPYNISRPGTPNVQGAGGAPMLNQRQAKQYEQAQRTIQNLQNQMQRGSMYGEPPVMYSPSSPGASNMPYGNSGQPSGYPPPSPLLQRISGQSPYGYQQQPQQQQQNPFASSGFRDSDYAAVANIAGLNPSDIALLHKEYLNLTRGGINKIDRVVFRQLLREALIDANSENVDRAIENIFISIDRNRDGFIDFPEFVGAFRDVLRSGSTDVQNYGAQYGISDLISEQTRATPAYICQPAATTQPLQCVPIPTSNVQQSPLIYNGSSPLVLSLDAHQTPYICNTQGQSITTQPTALQCVSLPMM